MVRLALAIALLTTGAGLSMPVAAGGTACDPPAQLRKSNLTNAADRMNGRSLVGQSWPTPPWRPPASPLGSFIVQSAVAIGGNAESDPNEAEDAASLIGALTSNPRRLFATKVFLSNSAVPAVAPYRTNLSRLFCVSRATLDWQSTESTMVDRAMKLWLHTLASRARVDILDSDGFVDTLSRMDTFGTTPRDHPLNLLSVLLVSGSFDSYVNQFPREAPVSMYDDGSVQGIRLKSSAVGISVYVFTGEKKAIQSLHDSFFSFDNGGRALPQKASDRWHSIAGGFEPKSAVVAPIHFNAITRSAFVPTLASFPSIESSRAFGLTISPTYNPATALGQAEIQVDGDKFSIVLVSGVEGTHAAAAETFDRIPPAQSSAFSLKSPSMYFVVDDLSGAMLAYGLKP